MLFKKQTPMEKELKIIEKAEEKLHKKACERTEATWKKELEKNEYELIISFGQAPLDIDTINIETIGKGDKKYKTKYDYTLLKNNLIKKSYKVIISEDAGTYLCNNIYFNGLKHIKENNLNTEMIFIHIPMIDEITNIENLASIFD